MFCDFNDEDEGDKVIKLLMFLSDKRKMLLNDKGYFVTKSKVVELANEVKRCDSL